MSPIARASPGTIFSLPETEASPLASSLILDPPRASAALNVKFGSRNVSWNRLRMRLSSKMAPSPIESEKIWLEWPALA